MERKYIIGASLLLGMLSAIWLISLAMAAPAAPPHFVYFQTSGLPAGVSITITGTRTNPGGQIRSYSVTFTSPGPSANITDEPGTVFTYNGFPDEVTVDGQLYELLNSDPSIPFTAGASGDSTMVMATYAAACLLPTITIQPISQTVVYGEPVTFTVSATGSEPLTYQWYKDGNPIQDAVASEYTIAAVSMADAGSYHVVVSNDCGSTPSNAATLVVNRADQVITFEQPPSPATYGTTFSVYPSASSGLPVTLAASGGCSNSGFDVTMTSGTLTCTLTASQPGDPNYNPAADVLRTVQAAKAEQIIHFEQPPSPVPTGTVFTVSTSASSGLPVSLSATGNCTLDGYTVMITRSVGACWLTASQLGDSNYLPAEDVVRVVETSEFKLFMPLAIRP